MFGGCGPYKRYSEVRVIGHYTCDQMRAAACGIAMCKNTAVPDKIREEAIAAHDGVAGAGLATALVAAVAAAAAQAPSTKQLSKRHLRAG